MKDNPYIGPRPYERRDRHNFFGRAREARDLLALVKAERAVLFYAQSGAGKTSLLNTQVIPALEEQGFNVLPVARVGRDIPPGIDPKNVPNIFVFSALMGLAGTFTTTASVELPGHDKDKAVRAMAFTPDNRWLVTASADTTVRLWDMQASGKPMARFVLRGHNGEVRAIAISPDNHWLITGGEDDIARLWDLTAADPSAHSIILPGHTGPVWSVAFSPASQPLRGDGQRRQHRAALATGDADRGGGPGLPARRAQPDHE
jgi:hypothetical protein